MKTRHADGDPDVLIVQTTIQYAASNTIRVVIGEDTDILVLLLYYNEEDGSNTYNNFTKKDAFREYT